MKKAATIIYAVGWTQHTFGTQIIRTAAMLQLLLGNVGRAGGGVNALRGHSNIQGATDMAGIFDILPGYLKMPAPDDVDFATYLKRTTPTSSKPAEWDSFNYWSNTPKFAVSFLKAMYGDAAKKENDWAFHYLPKIDRNYSWIEIWDDMYSGNVKGLFAFGMNGVADRPELAEEHRGAEEGRLAGRRRDLSGRDERVLACAGHDAGRDEEDPDDRLPAAVRRVRRKGRHVRQLGALAAVEERRAAAARRCAARSGHPRADLPEGPRAVSEGGRRSSPIRSSTCRWPYTRSAASVARPRWRKEINGQALADITDPQPASRSRPASSCPGSRALQRRRHHARAATGCTAARGPKPGNQTARRGTDDPSGLGIYPNWAWSWPANRRVMYNRASCDPSGKPWDPERRQVWWNEAAGRWVGNDVPDFKADSKPDGSHGPVHHESGRRRPAVRAARRVRRTGRSPSTTSRSRARSPIRCIRSNRTIRSSRSSRRALDKYGDPADGFNVICTTYRLTEHYHYWTKNNPMNVQLVPEPFVEIPVELADEMGLKGGERVKVSSARGVTTSRRRW